MKSNAEFYLGEYEKCRALYVAHGTKSSRHGKFYGQMMASMRKAYREARKENK